MLACAGCLAIAAPAAASTSTPTIEEMQAQIVTLQKQIAQLITLLQNRFQNNGNNGNKLGTVMGGGNAGLKIAQIGQGIYGEVTDVDDDSITVAAKKNGLTTDTKEYTVKAGNDIKVVKVTEEDGEITKKEIDFDEIEDGDTVFVRGAIDGTTVTATDIRVGEMAWGDFDTKEAMVRGTAAEDGDADSVTMTVTKLGSKTEKTYTVEADEDGVTVIKVVRDDDGEVTETKSDSLSGINEGDAMVVRGTIDDDVITATEVRYGDILGKKNGWDRGIVGKVTDDGTSEIEVTATNAKGEKTIYTVTEDDDCKITKVTKDSDGKNTEKDIELGDIEVDDTVWITGTVDDDEDTVVATRIRVGTLGWIGQIGQMPGTGNGAQRGQGNAWGFWAKTEK